MELYNDDFIDFEDEQEIMSKQSYKEVKFNPYDINKIIVFNKNSKKTVSDILNNTGLTLDIIEK